MKALHASSNARRGTREAGTFIVQNTCKPAQLYCCSLQATESNGVQAGVTLKISGSTLQNGSFPFSILHKLVCIFIPETHVTT